MRTAASWSCLTFTSWITHTEKDRSTVYICDELFSMIYCKSIITDTQDESPWPKAWSHVKPANPQYSISNPEMFQDFKLPKCQKQSLAFTAEMTSQLINELINRILINKDFVDQVVSSGFSNVCLKKKIRILWFLNCWLEKTNKLTTSPAICHCHFHNFLIKQLIH